MLLVSHIVPFPLKTRHCMVLSSIQPKLKSVRSLSKPLTVETGHCICVFSTSKDDLVQDPSLDKRAADFQVVNKLTHNLRHFVGSQPAFYEKQVSYVSRTHVPGHENLSRGENKLYTSLKIWTWMNVFRDVINSKATLPLIWIKKNAPFLPLTCRDQDSNLGYCGHNAMS